jgi:hypothetical protein
MSKSISFMIINRTILATFFGKRLSEIFDCFFVDSFLPGALLGLEGACGRLEVLDQQLPKLRQLQSLVLVVLVRVVLEVSHL